MTTLYDILGVPRSADQEHIAAAFRNLAKLHHPDAANGNAEIFKVINDAYSVLKDPYKRGAYDYQLMLKEEVEQEEKQSGNSTNIGMYQNYKIIALSVLSIIFGVYCFDIGDTPNKENYNGYIVTLGWFFVIIGIGLYLNRNTKSLNVKTFGKNIAISIIGLIIGYLRLIAIIMIPFVVLAVIFWINENFLHIPEANNRPIKPVYKNGKQVKFLENDD